MTELIRLRSTYFRFAGVALLVACPHHEPVAARSQTEHRIRFHEEGLPAPAGTRFAIQFNNEPPIVQVADGHGGPPILYHGRELKPEELKSVIILKRNEARERFGDQTLDYAILIEFR
jgi:hypothetical protein